MKKDCACKDSDPYICWAERYGFPRNVEYEGIEEDGGPCQCYCHEGYEMTCKNKKCCCKCISQYKTTVCNCFDDWPEFLVSRPSKYNKKHGSIGWACTMGMEEGSIEISRKKHGLCEEFIKRDKK